MNTVMSLNCMTCFKQALKCRMIKDSDQYLFIYMFQCFDILGYSVDGTGQAKIRPCEKSVHKECFVSYNVCNQN